MGEAVSQAHTAPPEEDAVLWLKVAFTKLGEALLATNTAPPEELNATHEALLALYLSARVQSIISHLDTP